MHVLLDPIVRSPKFPEYLRELNDYWRDLEARRAAFIEKVTPEDKAEFINGEEIWHSPAKLKHIVARERLSLVLHHWTMLHARGLVAGEKAMCAVGPHCFEPDIVYFSSERAASFRPDDVLFPVPDLVVEVISESTRERDRGIKFEAYAAFGVAEYWIVDPDERRLEQYLLRGERYMAGNEPIAGRVVSEVLPGLVFPVSVAFHDAALSAWLAELAKNKKA